MEIDLANYEGREQAYVKHHFLANYVELLVMKVTSRYDSFAYVDGYSGPWKNTDEDFADTSFGIALKAMRNARETWKERKGREIQMSAILVERDPKAYERLQAIREQYPEIRIKTINGTFADEVPTILAAVPSRAFSFVLIDPKGWKIDMQKVQPLIRRPDCEVLLNFMFDFVNRFATCSHEGVIDGLRRLLSGTPWEARLGAIDKDDAAAPAARKLVLVDAIRETIGKLGGYPYVMETPVLYPLRDRTFYSLVYATRSPVGVEVFRDCQAKTLGAQDDMRSAKKDQMRSIKSGMDDLLAGVDTGQFHGQNWLREQEIAAEKELLALAAVDEEGCKYKDLWPQVLAGCGVRKTRLGQMAANLKASGQLQFPDWEPKRRVPQDHYRVIRVQP